MKTLSYIKNGIFLLIPALLLVYGFNSQPNTATKSHVVEIKDMKFQPAVLTVHKGDTVIWINKDIVPHDVTGNNKAWASRLLMPKDSWRKVITESKSYYCSIHPNMKGKLIAE